MINKTSVIAILCLLLCNLYNCENNGIYLKDSETVSLLDSLNYHLEESKNGKVNYKEQLIHLRKSLLNCKNLRNDSLKLKQIVKISERAMDMNDSVIFFETNDKAYDLAFQVKDTFQLAESYYRLGTYYMVNDNLYDSYKYYNKANILFELNNRDYDSARMLYGMASIKNDLRDYTGSEKITFQAIKKLKKLNKNELLYLCYNLLGLNFYDLGEFEKSLFYHQRAMEYLNKTKNIKYYKPTSLNNIGLVYGEIGQYNKAIEYFEEGLNVENVEFTRPTLYPRLLDNLAYNKFKNGDTADVQLIFNKALKIRDSLNLLSGVAFTKLHLAEFYSKNRDTIKAVIFAKESEEITKGIGFNIDRLKALKLLSELDKKNASKYLETYIQLNDSIQAEERAVRNKSTRIEYETDEYIEETERLTTQNILISVIGGILVVLLAMLYFIRQQRAKNRELLFEQEQQRANEEIYGLILKQQTNLEEGRHQERERISEELHDGVLGKLFGARVGMGFLDLNGEETEIKEYKSFLDELQGIEKEIRDISHALKNNILKSDNSFVAVIDEYLSGQSNVHGFQYNIVDDKAVVWSAVEDKLKVTLYRIIQEAIQNIVKHAQANTVILTFSKHQKTLHLSIEDDGKGFNHLKSKKGIGLKNMESRILKHQGSLKVTSNLGQGTTINISVLTK